MNILSWNKISDFDSVTQTQSKDYPHVFLWPVSLWPTQTNKYLNSSVKTVLNIRETSNLIKKRVEEYQSFYPLFPLDTVS